MSDKVDQVAKALGDAQFGYVDPIDTPNTWAQSVSMAIEAIKAMRVPTEAMSKAGGEAHSGNEYFSPEEFSREAGAIYDKMIDEALK